MCCLLVKAAVSMKNHMHLMRVHHLQKMSVKTVMAMLSGRKRIRRILQYLQRLLQNLVSSVT
jgi:REP element-mobilizing transposase RayT